MEIQTTVNIAKTGTRSLKTTIPKPIVAFLNLENGDKLDWIMVVNKKQRITTIKKL